MIGHMIQGIFEFIRYNFVGKMVLGICLLGTGFELWHHNLGLALLWPILGVLLLAIYFCWECSRKKMFF